MSIIAVVDDEPDILLLVRLALEGAGHEVLVAETGEECLRLLSRTMPDMLLLDIGLPDIDGWAVLEKLCEAGVIQRLPVVILSAFANQNPRRAIEMGCRDYLTKPFSISQLVTAVEQATRG